MSNPCDAPIEVRKAYAKRLAPQLHKDHGKKHRYTRQQIDQSINNAELPIDAACWGYVMFLDQQTFDAIHAGSGESCHFEGMHLEMGGYLAESARAGGWLPSGFDFSLFDLGSWDWPDIGDFFDFDFDLPDIGDFGGGGDIG